MADNEPYTTKSAQTVDYERRLALEKGELPADDTEPRSFAVEGNDLGAYVGVSPEYMTYADVGQEPGVADEGADAVIEKRLREAPAGVVGAVSEPVKDDGDDEPKPQPGEVPVTGPADLSGAADQPGARGGKRASADSQKAGPAPS